MPRPMELAEFAEQLDQRIAKNKAAVDSITAEIALRELTWAKKCVCRLLAAEQQRLENERVERQLRKDAIRALRRLN
ncbi:MAG: hypothetical protein CMK32_09775 [Porticoccaceae bacterium]|nr:hypothetical protein [Porticoccaceae bacterium]|tara:strand:- start:311 stop:541 length:231 start_codon:yes stop_codon:yes gene_type:complete